MALDIKKLHEMTYEELVKINQQLMAQRAEIKQQQRLVVAELDKKSAQAKAQSKVAAMSVDEKAALSQVLRPSSIKSGESFS